jgi:hypothetical protein
MNINYPELTEFCIAYNDDIIDGTFVSEEAAREALKAYKTNTIRFPWLGGFRVLAYLPDNS